MVGARILVARADCQSLSAVHPGELPDEGPGPVRKRPFRSVCDKDFDDSRVAPHLDEILDSQKQMLIRRGENVEDTPGRRARLKEEYSRMVQRVRTALERRPQTRALFLNRDEVLDHPESAGHEPLPRREPCHCPHGRLRSIPRCTGSALEVRVFTGTSVIVSREIPSKDLSQVPEFPQLERRSFNASLLINPSVSIA